MFLAIGTGSQVMGRGGVPAPWPVALPLAVPLLDHLHLQPQFQSWRSREVGPSLGFSAESHPAVLPAGCGCPPVVSGGAAPSCLLHKALPATRGRRSALLCTDPVVSVVQLRRHQAPGMRWLLLDKTLLCTNDDAWMNSLDLHSTPPPPCAHSSCSHFTVKETEASGGAGAFQARAQGCVWEEELVAWWYAPAACCFLRCLGVGLSGITHEFRRPPRNYEYPL